MTPLQAIRKFCLLCCNDSSKEVAICPANELEPVCPLWPLRFGRGVKGYRPLKQIRLKCLDCSSESPAEVRECQSNDCLLYEYRMGKNPKLKGKGRTKEQMAKITAKRMAKISKTTTHEPIFELTQP